MTKQVTKTTIRSAKMKMVDGIPKAIPLDNIVMLGNIGMERAQREIDKIYDNATVLEVEPRTEIYEMLVEDFIKIAKLKE